MTAEQRLSRSPALPAHPLRVPPVVTSVAAEVDLVEEEAEAVVAVASMVVEADHTVEEEEDVVVAADTVVEEDMTKEVTEVVDTVVEAVVEDTDHSTHTLAF